MRKYLLIALLSITYSRSPAQTDSLRMAGIFQKITNELKDYKIDTSEAPDDKITRKINELRALRGGFNINEAISFKIQEDETKGEVPKTTTDFLKQEFAMGDGKLWLDNATVWIYRRHFNYKELKQLVKFYKTSAGQKLANDFPFIMMKTLMAAQLIHDRLIASMKK
jgi:uncharacterized protein